MWAFVATPTLQLQSYSCLCMITYQENCTGHFVWEQMEHCPWLGWLSGFTTCFKEVTSECECTHCVIHREMLASQKMSPELNNFLQDVVNIINHIKVYALGLPWWLSGKESACQLQETQFWSLVQEDTTCHGVTKPVHHSYWAFAREAGNHNYRSQHALESVLHNEKPLQWTAGAPNLE